MKYPRRWQDCPTFVLDLKRRAYLTPSGQELMSEGIYLYLYELWQDGVLRGWKKAKKAATCVRRVAPFG